MKIFFVYLDWTLEDIPRPFYVGKGQLARVKRYERNAYWKNIAAKYGWHREVVFATKDEQFSFEEEKRLITELGTFEDGTLGRWGANLTEGGEGPSGWKPSSEWKDARRGERNPRFGATNGPFLGMKHSEATRLKQSVAHQGSRNSNFGKSKEMIRNVVLTESVVHEIRRMWHSRETLSVRAFQRSTAILFDTTESNIANVVYYRTWKDL